VTHLLMISLDSSLLGDPHGNTVTRHIAYAERVGQISVIVYNPASAPKSITHLSDRLTVYPTNVPTPYLFPFVAFWRGVRVHRRQRADLITTQDPFATGLIGLLLKWALRLPLNVQNHSTFFNNQAWIAERPLRNRALHAIGKFVVKRADTHRVLTEGEKKHYLAMGIPAERVIVLPTPTDVALFAVPQPPERIAALRDSLGLAPDTPVILWVGLPAPVKHVELLLEAFRRVRRTHPAARLVMVGDFSRRPEFVQEARVEGVIFPGRVAHGDLPAYYQMASVYAHSSRYEGFGKVLVEALAAGTPVVSTDGDGPRDIVREGETGLLTPHTPGALAAAIAALLDDPERARAMGAAGQADVLARFEYTRQLDAVAETFAHTLEVARKGG